MPFEISSLRLRAEKLRLVVANLDHYHWRRNFATRVEAERHLPVGHHLLCEAPSHHLGQGLLFGLGLPSKLGAAVAETGNVVLQSLRDKWKKWHTFIYIIFNIHRFLKNY